MMNHRLLSIGACLVLLAAIGLNLWFMRAEVLGLSSVAREAEILRSMRDKNFGERVMQNPNGPEELAKFLNSNGITIRSEGGEFTTYLDVLDAYSRGVPHYFAKTEGGNLIMLTYTGRCKVPIVEEPRSAHTRDLAGVMVASVNSLLLSVCLYWRCRPKRN